VLSLQKCRVLLGTDCKLTDLEVEQLRQELYALSDVVFEAFRTQRKTDSQTGPPAKEPASCISVIPNVERDEVEERAAILEFEAGLRRPEAERQAFGEWAQRRQTGKKKRRKKAVPARKRAISSGFDIQ
jgi:hypothetical protein